MLFLVMFFALSTACFAFDDVPQDHPWADGIFYLEQTGIIKGNSSYLWSRSPPNSGLSCFAVL